MIPRRVIILVLLSALLVALAARAEVTPENPTATLQTGGAPLSVDLKPFFREAAARGSVVRVNVRIGDVTKPIYLGLNDQTQPLTVANFVRYVQDGKYNGTFFHRLVRDFVLQGGGFSLTSTGAVTAIPTYPAVQNEPGLSNLRGTIAMAKLGNQPNSATSQWFVNLGNNAANLDFQNGGFTVFGSVLRSGMEVIDQVAALNIYDASGANSALDEIPLVDGRYVVSAPAAMVAPLAPTAVSSNPQSLSTSLSGSTLLLTAGPYVGSATVKLSAADIDGTPMQRTLAVQVVDWAERSAGWHVANGSDGQTSAFTFDPSDTSAVPGNTVTATWDDAVDLSQSVTRTFTVTNGTDTPNASIVVGKYGPQAADFTVSSGPNLPSLEPGASTTFTVTFKPGAIGDRRALLRVTSGGDGVGPSFDIALSATGKRVVPVFGPLAPQRVVVDERGLAQIPDFTGEVAATDELGPVTVTQSPAPGTVLSAGQHTLTFTAKNILDRSTTAQTPLSLLYSRLTTGGTRQSGAYSSAAVPSIGGENLAQGSTLTVFGTPAISDDRHLAAKVTIASGAARLAGIYLEDGAGARKLVARQNAAAGVGSFTFKSFHDPLLSPSGKIAFWANINGAPATADEGVWTDAFGPLEPVLREGAAIPGLGTLKLKTITSLELRDDGLLALVKLMPAAGAVVLNVNDTALVRITSKTTGTLLARTRQPHGDSLVQQISAMQPSAKSPGQGRWAGSGGVLAKFTLVSKSIHLVKIDSAGVATTLLQTGLPGANFSARLATLSLPAIGGNRVAVLATKALATGATTALNDSTILFASTGPGFTEALTEDAAADVTGTTNVAGTSKFATFTDPAVNDLGAILFSATLRGGKAAGSNLGGLWQTDGLNAPEPIARLGAPATDADGHDLVNTTWSSFVSFALPDGQNAGAIFRATLAGKGTTAATNAGLWAVDSTGLIRLLLRTGQTITLPSGDKKISAFTVLNALPGSFGARRSYNSRGSVAVQVTFVGGHQAILRLDIP